jgi:hypothetical protein
VCQLNVVRSFGIILDVLNHVFDAQDRLQQSDLLTPPTSPRAAPEHDRIANSAATATSGGSKLTPEHRRLTMRLAPLREIEHALTRRLRSCSYAPITPPHSPLGRSRSNQELYLSGYAWQRVREHRPGAEQCTENGDEDEGLTRVLCACQDDMVTLWNDPFVRKLLKVQRVGMEELSSL